MIQRSRQWWSCLIVVGGLSFVVGRLHAAETPSDLSDLPLLVSDDFEQGAARWQPTDAEAWKIIDLGSGHAYSLFQQSKYKPPHRSPLNFSLLKDEIVSDFALDVRVRSTKTDYPHRDMCLVFGYQDPAHFYYVHFGKRTDDHANQIFIVNDAPRVKISTHTTPGTNWDDEWHRIRLVRHIDDGTIEVYFDHLQAPVMRAVDKTFTWGRIGLGSFDDIGDWDEVRLFGKRVEGK